MRATGGHVSQSFALQPAECNSVAPPCDCLAPVQSNAADRPQRVLRYPSDVTDAEWAEVRALLPIPGRLDGRNGQPEGYRHRQRAALRSLFACPWGRWCTTRYTTDDPPRGTVAPGVSCAPKRTASQRRQDVRSSAAPVRFRAGAGGLERRTPASHHPAPPADIRLASVRRPGPPAHRSSSCRTSPPRNC